MSWKCVCKEENSDDSQYCSNCARKKPKYLGVKLEIESTQEMSQEQKAVWYLMISHDHLRDANRYLGSYRESKEHEGDESYNQTSVRNNMVSFQKYVETNCEKCLNILEKSESLFPDAQFKGENGVIQNISSIKSECFFTMGSLHFNQDNFSKAIDYYRQSYDSDPNQVSIYNIAMATRNLPVEGGGIFSGKKKQAAIETKKEQEIDWLKKTIKIAPFSSIGVKSGRLLINDYNIAEIDI